MLIWCDGFDHYGTGSGGGVNMTDGAWAQNSATANNNPATANPRTGTHAFHFSAGFLVGFIRRTFGSDKEVVGIGYAIYPTALPSTNRRLCLALFRNNANADVLSLWMTTTGQVEAVRGGGGGTLLGTSGQVFTAAAYQHFECRVRIHDTLGEVEVRVNGVAVLTLSGVDTNGQATTGTAQVVLGDPSGNGMGNTWQIDDLFAWDDSGDYNNDFIGDRRVATLFPIADVSPTDWVRNTGSDDYAAIDDVAPDDDTTYIAATPPAGSPPVNPTSDFQKTALPSNIAGISAVYLVGLQRKTDAGACNTQMSLVSSDVGSPPAPAVASGADRPITEAWTYFGDVLETDPATGAPWTPAALDDALFRIERTA